MGIKISDWSMNDRYRAVPNDWTVVIADIVDSSKAIANGRYKEINVLGAACLISVTNAIGAQYTHGVFGGDGATFVVAPEHLNLVESALGALRTMATTTFGVQLRVGRVAVSQLRSLGSDVRMAKVSMHAGFQLSLFTGGGVALADQLIKQDPKRYWVKAASQQRAVVKGLECRWNDVPSTRGTIMTILVRPRAGDVQALADILLAIDRLLPDAQPVRTSNLPITYPPTHLWAEMKLKQSNPIWRACHYLGVLILTGALSFFIQRQAFNPTTRIGRYCLSSMENTDHVKLDDVLRAVLDVSHADAKRLETLLEEKKQQQLIDYGIHYSDRALMTCFVQSLESRMHFIDGADGGYAAAARQLGA